MTESYSSEVDADVVINEERYRMMVLSEACGMGRHEGDIGSKSSGDPLSGDIIFPAPKFNHTSALGHRSVMH